MIACISVGPPPPTRPRVVKLTSQSVTLAWEENKCTGGHTIESFSIRHSTVNFFPFDFFRRYKIINGIDKNVRNYTITDLTPSTTYDFSVQAVDIDGTSGHFSVVRSVTTLAPGIQSQYYNYDEACVLSSHQRHSKSQWL